MAVLDLCLAWLHYRCLLCVHDRSVTYFDDSQASLIHRRSYWSDLSHRISCGNKSIFWNLGSSMACLQSLGYGLCLVRRAGWFITMKYIPTYSNKIY